MATLTMEALQRIQALIKRRERLQREAEALDAQILAAVQGRKARKGKAIGPRFGNSGGDKENPFFRYRKRRKLTQRAAAEATGVPAGTWGHYERETSYPRAEHVERIKDDGLRKAVAAWLESFEE